MNFNLKFLSLFLFIFVSSSLFAQYKYDIGLRASSSDLERFQLEQRFHLKSPYSIVATLAHGSVGTGNSSQSELYNDSLIDIVENYYLTTNNALKVGVQRKLGFFASDVFYAGATLGFGVKQQRDGVYSATFSVEDTINFNPYLFSQGWTELSSTRNITSSKAVNTQFGLSFGMDVPLSKRFSVNAEVSFAAIWSKSLTYSYSYIYMVPSFSGGLRYSFGKRE